MKNLHLVLILVFLSAKAWSQDKIYKKGGEIIEAKTTEVGADEIKYRIFNDQSGPIIRWIKTGSLRLYMRTEGLKLIRII